MEIKLSNFTAFLKILSWRKIVQLIVLILVLGVTYGLWENRVVVYNSLKVGARYESAQLLTIDLSTSSKAIIDATVLKGANNIVGIQIVGVDFKKNSRMAIYSSFNNSELRKLFDNFQRDRLGPSSLFTENEANNQRTIDLINGEFTCSEYSATMIGHLLPTATRGIKTVCSVSIPPYYGKFSGYLNVLLSAKPDTGDLNLIRYLSRGIANKIYDTDIDRSIRHQKE